MVVLAVDDEPPALDEHRCLDEQVDSAPVGLGGGPARAGVRFWPDAPSAAPT